MRELFPRCPPGIERAIAQRACPKSSGRVGRSATAKALDADTVRLAVVAHVCRVETCYEELLGAGYERHDARRQVQERVSDALCEWSTEP